ncbi:Peptide chain release factor APG3, chloroplastic, partial [Linum grandiflorum]
QCLILCVPKKNRTTPYLLCCEFSISIFNSLPPGLHFCALLTGLLRLTAMATLTTNFPARLFHNHHKSTTPTRPCDCVFFRHLSPARITPGIVCMAEPHLIAKLESAEKTWKEFSVRLADPDVVSNPNEYKKLAQSVSELDEVVSMFRRFKDCEKQLEETKALSKEVGNDEDMAEMITSEIDSLSREVKELEEKLKLMLLPSDPLDARNIMLEVRAGTGGDEAGIWAGDLVGPHVSKV